MDDKSIKAAQEAGAVYFIFGAAGDLAHRKLYPALYSMYHKDELKGNFAIIGLSLEERSHDEFCDHLYRSIQEFGHCKPDSNDGEWDKFIEHIQYMSLDIDDTDGFYRLKQAAEQLEEKFKIAGNRLFYLALPPDLFDQATSNIKKGGLLESNGWHRLVIEKPFGSDLLSAQKLNQDIRKVFADKEIFRLDHYLGKEMVQNINAVRFANSFFEFVWNNKYISNIQITMSETNGVEERGGYYDQAGALRDMGQNHMLQMLAMMAMEPPGRLCQEDIHDEKVKVFRALRVFSTATDVNKNVVRGQYSAGELDGKQKLAYRAEKSVAAKSNTETYFAAKVFVDNFRWAGVPFYIRTGKRLPVKTTEIVVEFKNAPDHVYFAKENRLEPNLLVFRVSPLEGIYFKMNAKKLSSRPLYSHITPIVMDFSQTSLAEHNSTEAYELLLFDAASGDSSYFTKWEEIELAWGYVDKIAATWEKNKKKLKLYPAGSWGPKEAQQLLEKDGFRWWPVNGQLESEAVWVTGRS